LSDDKDFVQLATTTRFRRALDGVKNSRPNASGLTTEYSEYLASEMEKFRISTDRPEFEERVLKSIEDFIPYRNQYVELVSELCIYGEDHEIVNLVHKFFEAIAPYRHRPAEANSWSDWDFDNFRFNIQGLFLYTVALMIKSERYQATSEMLQTEYYYRLGEDAREGGIFSYESFQHHLKSLDSINNKKNPRALSLFASLVSHRCKEISVQFIDIMQADFRLGLISFIEKQRWVWYPDTLVYAGRLFRPFEVFARSRSTKYFNRTKGLLGVMDKADLAKVVQELETDPRKVPTWQFDRVDVRLLLGFDELATRP
jgi:hypothetical protein